MEEARKELSCAEQEFTASLSDREGEEVKRSSKVEEMRRDEKRSKNATCHPSPPALL